MRGVAPSAWAQSVEQETPLPLHPHSVEFDKTLRRKANGFPLNSDLYMRIHAAVFTVAAILLLIALTWRCLSSRSRVSTSGLGRRRLASGGGQQGEDDDQEPPPACTNVEEILAAQGREDFGSSPPPQQSTGTSVGGGADEERPRTRKRKTKHHEEDTEETSEQRAKIARMDEGEMDLDSDLGPVSDLDPELVAEALMGSLFPFFEEPTSSSSPAPPFSPESEEQTDLDTLEKQLIKGKSTLVQWLLDPKDDVPLTSEEERMPQGSVDAPLLEGTSQDFPSDLSSHAVESADPSEPSGDAEMPSTSGAVSDVHPLPSHPPLPHVSQPSQEARSGSLLEGSGAPPRGTALKPFNQYHCTHIPNIGRLGNLLSSLEVLLRKQSRSQQDLQAIINRSEIVYEHAKMRFYQSPKRKKARTLVRMLVLRVLTVDALWRACAVVGPPMKQHEWWPRLMATVFGNSGQWSSDSARVSFHSYLLEEMVRIMECFSRGTAPPTVRMANLIRAVFDKQTGIPILRGSEWDLWREGDDDS